MSRLKVAAVALYHKKEWNEIKWIFDEKVVHEKIRCNDVWYWANKRWKDFSTTEYELRHEMMKKYRIFEEDAPTIK